MIDPRLPRALARLPTAHLRGTSLPLTGSRSLGALGCGWSGFSIGVMAG